MKTNFSHWIMALAILAALDSHLSCAPAQGTAFTYQGQLSVGTNAVTGSFDLQFALFDAPVNGTQQGAAITNIATGVTNGLFSLALDFGNQFSGANRWLQIAVRTNGTSSFTNLTPREPLLPVPSAIYAESAGTVTNSAISASNLNTLSTPGTGQVLSYNGAGLSWTTPGFALPYSGSAASSGSLFTLQNTASGPAGSFLGNVGIGTTTPVAQLDVLTSTENGSAVSGSNALVKVYGQLALAQTLNDFEFTGDVYAGVYGNDGFTAPSYISGNGNYAGLFDGVVACTGDIYDYGNIHELGHMNAEALDVDGLTIIYGNSSASALGVTNAYSNTPTLTCAAVNGNAQSGIGVNGSGYIGVLGSTANMPYGRGVLGSATGGANSWGGLFTYGSTGNNAAYLGGNGAAAIFYGGVTVAGSVTSGYLFQVGSAYCDGTGWYPSSDRNIKSGFEDVSARAVLEKVAALPITRWHYTNDLAATHIGPMAQDFYAAFKIGPDDKRIGTIDEGGVALAAIQGLNQKLEETRAQNLKLKRQNESLVQRLDELEAVVSTLAQKK